MILVELLALVLLFLCSAFFAASEAAVTALPSLKMKQLSVLRPHLVRHFDEWLSKPHRLLVTILVGNNMVNVAISSLSALLAVPLFALIPAGIVEVLVWLVTTVVLLVFGDIVPKIIGRVYAERISVWTLPLLSRASRFFAFAFRPVHWFLEKFAPRLGNPPVNKLTVLSLEEMHHIIGESQATGHVPRESGEMMNRALSLHRRTVADIMQPASAVDTVALELLDRSSNASELFVDLLVESGRSRVPVTRAGVPVGVVHVMDLLKEWRSGRAESLDELIRPPRWASPGKSVSELLTEFQQSGDHIALVEGENGEFLGLVTLEDALEEIVGEIVDEYDLEQKKQ